MQLHIHSPYNNIIIIIKFTSTIDLQFFLEGQSLKFLRFRHAWSCPLYAIQLYQFCSHAVARIQRKQLLQIVARVAVILLRKNLYYNRFTQLHVQSHRSLTQGSVPERIRLCPALGILYRYCWAMHLLLRQNPHPTYIADTQKESGSFISTCNS